MGRRLRMGIFTKRDVLKDEEITFNYNVDRYGYAYGPRMPSAYTRFDAQDCFCGEPNCVGAIGGKTQTDVAGMSQLFIEGARLGLWQSRAHLCSAWHRGRGRGSRAQGQQEEEVQEDRCRLPTHFASHPSRRGPESRCCHASESGERDDDDETSDPCPGTQRLITVDTR